MDVVYGIFNGMTERRLSPPSRFSVKWGALNPLNWALRIEDWKLEIGKNLKPHREKDLAAQLEVKSQAQPFVKVLPGRSTPWLAGDVAFINILDFRLLQGATVSTI